MKFFTLVLLSLMISCSNKNEYQELKLSEEITWMKLEKQSKIVTIYAENNDLVNYEVAIKELKKLEESLQIIHEKLANY